MKNIIFAIFTIMIVSCGGSHQTNYKQESPKGIDEKYLPLVSKSLIEKKLEFLKTGIYLKSEDSLNIQILSKYVSKNKEYNDKEQIELFYQQDDGMEDKSYAIYDLISQKLNVEAYLFTNDNKDIFVQNNKYIYSLYPLFGYCADCYQEVYLYKYDKNCNFIESRRLIQSFFDSIQVVSNTEVNVFCRSNLWPDEFGAQDSATLADNIKYKTTLRLKDDCEVEFETTTFKKKDLIK